MFTQSGAQDGTKLTKETTKPNIVFILTDDMTVGEMRYMPHVKRHLVERGTTFSNAFVTTATCCPSRASTLRGQYPHNHGVLHNIRPYGGYSVFWKRGLERSNVATWLQGAGYETALFGKYINGYCWPENECGISKRHVPRGWDNWQAWTGGFTNLEMNINRRIKDYPDSLHPDLILREKAFRYTERRHAKPFFLFLSLRAPHTPLRSPDKLDGMFKGKYYPRVPSFNERDMSDKPGYAQKRPLLTRAQRAQVDRDYQERLRMLTVVDRTIPGLISRLKNTGELANTVFVFTSDNGYHYGLHRHPFGKNLPYEEDMRVPLVDRGPGIEKATGRDEFVLNNDLAPTFADLAGAKVPGFVDGRSFRTLAEASGGSNFGEPFARENFLFEGHPGRAFRGYGLPPYKTIRTSRYIYTEYAAGSKELYDIIADPYQLENIAGKRPSLEADLSARLRTLKNCAGDSCRAAENSS